MAHNCWLLERPCIYMQNDILLLPSVRRGSLHELTWNSEHEKEIQSFNCVQRRPVLVWNLSSTHLPMCTPIFMIGEVEAHPFEAPSRVQSVWGSRNPKYPFCI